MIVFSKVGCYPKNILTLCLHSDAMSVCDYISMLIHRNELLSPLIRMIGLVLLQVGHGLSLQLIVLHFDHSFLKRHKITPTYILRLPQHLLFLALDVDIRVLSAMVLQILLLLNSKLNIALP